MDCYIGAGAFIISGRVSVVVIDRCRQSVIFPVLLVEDVFFNFLYKAGLQEGLLFHSESVAYSSRSLDPALLILGTS